MAFKVTMSFRITAAITTLLGLPFRSESVGEVPLEGINRAGDRSGIVKRLAKDGGSPDLDVARALERAAIVVDWREACDAGGLALCELPSSGM